MQCLVNTVDESELPSQAVTVFAWSSKKHVLLHYPDGRLCVLLTNSRSFSSSAAFSWSNWEQYLLELVNHLVFWKELINRGLPSNPTIYTTSHSLAFGVVGGGSFRLPHNLFCSTLLYSIHFSLPVTTCLKTGTISLRLRRETHAEI